MTLQVVLRWLLIACDVFVFLGEDDDDLWPVVGGVLGALVFLVALSAVIIVFIRRSGRKTLVYSTLVLCDIIGSRFVQSCYNQA